MKKIMKNIVKVATGLVVSFAFATAVFALSGSVYNVYFNNSGDQTYLTSSGSMSTYYKSNIQVTSISGSNEIATDIQLPVLWWYTTERTNYQTFSSIGSYGTYWTANGTYKTRFLWRKIGSDGSVTTNLSYYDL